METPKKKCIQVGGRRSPLFRDSWTTPTLPSKRHWIQVNIGKTSKVYVQEICLTIRKEPITIATSCKNVRKKSTLITLGAKWDFFPFEASTGGYFLLSGLLIIYEGKIFILLKVKKIIYLFGWSIDVGMFFCKYVSIRFL